LNEKTLFQYTFGKYLRFLRNNRNLTQQELAAKAELSKNYIQKVENGRHSPSAYTLFKLNRALELSDGQLLKEIRLEMDKVQPRKQD
jgi:transcriptional regulator with XRE-family HTH domain